MSRYKYILFDLDGTITEPFKGISGGIIYALEKYGIKPLDEATLRKFIGPPLRDSFRDYCGFSDEQAEEATAYYREYYSVKGLEENGFITNDYDDWDGYIVIEESNKNYHYAIWITNGKYVIDGYDSTKIAELDLDNGIEKYNDDSFTSKVKTSFTGTSGDKGGTGSSDGSSLTRFEAACVNEKVE